VPESAGIFVEKLMVQVDRTYFDSSFRFALSSVGPRNSFKEAIVKSLLPLFVASIVLLTSNAAFAKPPAPHTQWKTLGTLPFVWIQDMSFVNAHVGYAAGGNGQIWKTADGAETWQPVLSVDYPYYWYGVQALNANDVVISGFISFSEGPAAVIRWSHDGGASWSDDVVLGTALGNRVHFWNASTGFVTGFAGDPNIGFRTTTGGSSATDWSTFTIDPSGGWSGAQFSALANGHVRISGINFCESLDFARTWTCEPSIDPASDYATFFINDKKGWVGGGGGIGVPEGSPPLF
jgi:photosystem II stability/assembly factor-like uncharacterized protein